MSQGWAEGLPALVPEHGVRVADEPEPRLDVGVRTAPGEERLSLVKRQALGGTGGAGHRQDGFDEQAVLDGVVHRVVERMVPVAIRLDDDGVLECHLYARSFARPPDLRVAELERWPAEYLHLTGYHGGTDYGPIGAANEEIPIMREIVSALKPGSPMPTPVLFFTDGGFSKKREITALVREAAQLPAFWQFVGIGKANYGLLEKLDALDRRVVDNVGFLAVDDLDSVGDGELYRRLLSEFPDWLTAARAARIVG